jgi:hypothetical protein
VKRGRKGAGKRERAIEKTERVSEKGGREHWKGESK